MLPDRDAFRYERINKGLHAGKAERESFGVVTGRYVLDACALIAALADEEGAVVIGDLLKQAARTHTISISIAKINLLEVYYDIYKRMGVRAADSGGRSVHIKHRCSEL
jgi:hypothetical protein